MSYEEDVKQEFLNKGMHPPKDEYLQGFPHGLGLKKRIPFKDFDAWLKSCPIPYYLSSEMSDQEQTYTFDLRNLMDKYDEEQIEVELFDDMLDFFLGDSLNYQTKKDLWHECEQDEQVKLDVINHWLSFNEEIV